MKKILFFIIGCVFALTACNGRTKKAPDVDLSKCISELESNLVLEPDYYYVEDYNLEFKDKDITITAVVSDGTSSSNAMEFADTLLRQLNMYASYQDGSISLGNSDGYGGLYDHYSASVGIAHRSKVNSNSEWVIHDAITSSKDKLKTK